MTDFASRIAALRVALEEPAPVADACLTMAVDDLRRRLDPKYAKTRDREDSWLTGPRGLSGSRPAGSNPDACARCGDCGARRSMNTATPCGACGSDQPPRFSGIPAHISARMDAPLR